jgi:hypothetical protein
MQALDRSTSSACQIYEQILSQGVYSYSVMCYAVTNSNHKEFKIWNYARLVQGIALVSLALHILVAYQHSHLHAQTTQPQSWLKRATILRDALDFPSKPSNFKVSKCSRRVPIYSDYTRAHWLVCYAWDFLCWNCACMSSRAHSLLCVSLLVDWYICTVALYIQVWFNISTWMSCKHPCSRDLPFRFLQFDSIGIASRDGIMGVPGWTLFVGFFWF